MNSEAFKTIYLDLMDGNIHIGQLPYKYCALFPIDEREVRKYVLQKRPSLKGRNIRVEFSNQRV